MKLLWRVSGRTSLKFHIPLKSTLASIQPAVTNEYWLMQNVIPFCKLSVWKKVDIGIFDPCERNIFGVLVESGSLEKATPTKTPFPVLITQILYVYPTLTPTHKKVWHWQYWACFNSNHPRKQAFQGDSVKTNQPTRHEPVQNRIWKDLHSSSQWLIPPCFSLIAGTQLNSTMNAPWPNDSSVMLLVVVGLPSKKRN